MPAINVATGDGAITLGSHATNPETGTFCFWVRATSWTFADNKALFEQRNVSTGAGYCRIGGDTGSTASRFGPMISYATKDSVAYMDTSALSINAWYYFAFTLDAQSVAPRIFSGNLYTRAAEVSYASTPAVRATGTGARTSDGGATAYLGQSKYQYGIDSRGKFPGSIAYFSWYDTVLTDSQIKAHQYITKNWGIAARQMLRPGWHGLSGCPDISGNVRNATFGAGCAAGLGLPLARRWMA